MKTPKGNILPSEKTYILYRVLPRQRWSLTTTNVSFAPFQIRIVGYENAIAEQKRLNDQMKKKPD